MSSRQSRPGHCSSRSKRRSSHKCQLPGQGKFRPDLRAEISDGDRRTRGHVTTHCASFSQKYCPAVQFQTETCSEHPTISLHDALPISAAEHEKVNSTLDAPMQRPLVMV